MTLERKAQNWDEIVRVVREVDALRRPGPGPGPGMPEDDVLDVAVRALRVFPQQSRELAQARADLEAARRELRGGLAVLDPAKLVPLRHMLPTFTPGGLMVAPRYHGTPGGPLPGCKALVFWPPGGRMDYPVAVKSAHGPRALTEVARQCVLHLGRGALHESIRHYFEDLPDDVADELADYLYFNREDLVPWIRYSRL